MHAKEETENTMMSDPSWPYLPPDGRSKIGQLFVSNLLSIVRKRGVSKEDGSDIRWDKPPCPLPSTLRVSLPKKAEFKTTHKQVDQVRSNDLRPGELRTEIGQLEDEKKQLTEKIGKLKGNVADEPGTLHYNTAS